MTEWIEDPADNATVGASGGYFPPDTRTEEEKQQDRRRYRRRQRVRLWRWRLRGLLPRGWKDEE